MFCRGCSGSNYTEVCSGPVDNKWALVGVPGLAPSKGQVIIRNDICVMKLQNGVKWGRLFLPVPRWRHQMDTFSVLLALCAGNSPVNSPHKGQWRGALMFSLISAWLNGRVDNREAGDLRRHRAHYDVTVMPMPAGFCTSSEVTGIFEVFFSRRTHSDQLHTAWIWSWPV